MPIWTAQFETDANYAEHEFEADTPEQALKIARELDVDAEGLYFGAYSEGPSVHTIVISGERGVAAVWKSDEQRLHEAAPELLPALEAVIDDPRADSFLQTQVLEQACAAITMARPESHPERQHVADPPEHLAEEEALHRFRIEHAAWAEEYGEEYERVVAELDEQYPVSLPQPEGPDLEP
jgi:hypothetical protein